MFDSKILESIPHFQAHKTFLPYIPEGYSKKGMKIFIIGESHYLPKEYNNTFTPDEWYYEPESVYNRLSTGSVEWVNTRGVINYFMGPDPLARGHRIFLNLSFQ